MRNIFVIAIHDLRLTLTDRGALAWLFLLPIVFATFFGLVMGGGSSPVDIAAELAVVDLDQTPISQGLIDEIEGEGVNITELTEEERRIDRELVRVLVIPEGFASGVLTGEQQVLRLEKEPDTSQEAALVVQARIVAAIARLLGRLVEAGQGVDQSEAISTEAFLAVEVPADLVTMEVKVAGGASVIPDGFALSIPGNAVMFVLLVALTYGAASISGERRSGNLRRLVTAPVRRGEIITGKIVGRFTISALQITVMVLIAVIANRTLGVYIGDHPTQTWMVLLLFGAVVAPLGVLVGGMIADPDRAASVGVILTMVMAAFGGCWWPLEVVSKPLKTVALLFPTGWAMRTLHGLISFGQTLGDLKINLLVLAGFGLVFFAIAWRSLRVD